MQDDDITPYMGYGAQQQIRRGYGDEQQLAYNPPAPASDMNNGVALPPGLATRMAQVPTEVFDIFPGYPNAAVSSLLGLGVIGVETTIHTFSPPTGNYVVINPSDLTQEVLLETFNTATTATYIKGLINIYTRTGLQGFQQRLYSGGSEFHNPAQQMASMGNRRRWQFGAIISPGDTMETRFLGADTFGTVASHLDHRVSIKKVTP
jgi:hypothetical protein